MKIVIIQMNPTVGDVFSNAEEILRLAHAHSSADLIVFPEMALTGYPPKDLIVRHDFLCACEEALNKIASNTKVPLLVGAGVKSKDKKLPFNAAVLCTDGAWRMVAKKILLPNYNVFDDKRYFAVPDDVECSILAMRGRKLLISICEDAWASIPNIVDADYPFDPIKNAVLQHGRPDAIINMSASPFSMSKPKKREEVFIHIAKTWQTPVLVCGQTGANDQLMFDGHSMVIDQNGAILSNAKACQEDFLVYDFVRPTLNQVIKRTISDEQLLLEVLCMGIRDYVNKCQAGGIVIGISGGIDSAVCAALCVRALGAGRVKAMYLPSRFNSEQSLVDARTLAANLSLKLEILPIEDTLNAMRSLLTHDAENFSHKNVDIVDQNLQARMRGMVLMAVCNATDYLMVTTSNKSELAVGYATLYGDLCGAFSPVGDLYKNNVYNLAKQINTDAGFYLVPESIINKKPSAELKYDQLDSDSLPEYDILDKILFNFIDLEKSASAIEALSIDRPVIDRVIAMVNKSEYKRRQAPLAFMVSDKVFGDARRLPIAKRL